MLPIILVLILAPIGVIDSAVRCINFALDTTRGFFARGIVALTGLVVTAVLAIVLVPVFNGELAGEGLGAAIYVISTIGPFAVVFALLGVYAIYDRLRTHGGWLADQFRSRTDR